MGNIDGFRAQVENLKQRLSGSGEQQRSNSDELKTRLATIKSSLESKQAEIEQLVDEIKQLATENGQLHALLKEVLSVTGGQQSDGPAEILRDFFAATDPLIGSAAGRGSPIAPDRQPEARPDTRADGRKGAQPGKADPSEVASKPAPGADGKDIDVENSTALRRIMRRSNRAG